MTDQFKLGDVVELKSGGPDMTINAIGDNNGITSAWCAWFVGTKQEQGVFPLTSLKRARGI